MKILDANRVKILDANHGPGRQPRFVGRGGAGAGRLAAFVAAAFGAGVVIAKMLDWRGHAHPRL